MQMAAINRPAAKPPGLVIPASTIVVPQVSRDTPTR